MTQKTRGDLVEAVADQYGEYRRVTATSGSTTTVADTTALYQPDDFWTGHYAYVLAAGGAAPEGEERPVTDFEQSANRATVSPAFSAAVAAGDTIEFLPLQRDIIVRAINAAIRAGDTAWLVIKTDESTVTLAADDYDYTLPTDVVSLCNVYARTGTDEPWAQVPARNWRVAGLPGAQVLIFDSLNGLDTTNDTLRLEYLARVSEMGTDAATLGLGEPAERGMVAFIIQYALYWLHDRASGKTQDSGLFQRHYTKAEQCHAKAVQIKKEAERFVLPGTMRAPRWPRARG